MGVQYGLKANIAFTGTKTIVSWLQRATWNKRYRVQAKSVALLQNCKWKLKKNVKKCFFLRKLTKMTNLILCFSDIPKIFICVLVRQSDFLS